MKKLLNLRIEALARDEINSAYYWYEDQSNGLGEKFLKALDLAFNNIQKTPKGYQKTDSHRQYPMIDFPFVILYEATKDTLFIDAVFHTSRNPDEKIR